MDFDFKPEPPAAGTSKKRLDLEDPGEFHKNTTELKQYKTSDLLNPSMCFYRFLCYDMKQPAP
jgi:hypothetical protein